MAAALADIAGGCRCAAVRFSIAASAPPPVYCCHCRDCQRSTGSAFTVQMVVMAAMIAVEGAVAGFDFPRPAGGVSTHHMCAACHTRLWTTNTARPMLAVIRAGTLDDTSALSPRAHLWVSRKQPWVLLAEGIPAYPADPPAAEFASLLMRRRA